MKVASQAAGLGETYVRDVIVRGRGKVDLIERVVRVLDPTAVDFVLKGVRSEEGTYRPPPEILGTRDLPVFSAVEGGPGEMVISTDPIEWVQRPWFLREVKEGYAVVVIGDSMAPLYEPGDIVIVNPRLPAIPNKNAIFVGGEDRGEFIATVKRLNRSTEKDWHVRQHNPPHGASHDFTLPKSKWPRALRVVGKYEG